MDLAWCHRLESSAAHAIVGKVLCVCAAAAVARTVLAAQPGAGPECAAALALLDQWIDDPTEDRFRQICDTIFSEGELPDLGPGGVAWWALRTATSSVGNYEAGWALASTCGPAVDAGFTPAELRGVVERALLARAR